ncbi:MAG: MMPL family transporter, partial [Gammaproteobacteria bacterium]|nr:MMPL family transporter [Gammaproteobacteria bacterium]
MHELEAKFGHWVLKWRWLIILLSLVIVVLAASGAKNLSLTTNYRVFFSADNPQLLAFDELENTYTKNDNVMFVLTPKNGDVFTPQALAAVESLTKAAWQLPFSIRVDSISNFQHTEADGDELIVRDLVSDARSLDNHALDKIRQVALNEPLLVQRLVSPSSKVTAVNATIQLPGKDEIHEIPDVVSAARAMAAQLRQDYPDIEVRLTGMVMMNSSFSESSQKDMQSLIPLSFLVMVIFLALLLRDFQRKLWMLFAVTSALFALGSLIALISLPAIVIGLLILTGFGILLWAFPATITTVLVIVLSALAAMGLGGHIGFPITPPSASAPTIILTVAIANSVHILITFLHEMHQGMSRQAAIIESLRVNLQPVFLTSLTTAIGFLTMNFSEVPPFRHLGNFVAFGVIASFFLSVTFLPAVISLLPVTVRKISRDRDTLMEKLGNFVVRQRSRLLVFMTIFVIGLILFIPKNELNDIFVHYFDHTVPFRMDADYTTANLTGLYVADYSLNSGETGGVSNPAFLKDVESFANWYRQQPETMHVNVYTDIMKRLNKNMHADDPVMYKLPDQRDLAAQYLLLYEMSLPYGLDLNNQINVDKSATRMTVSIQTLSSNQVLELEQRARNWLAENAPNIKTTQGSGPTIMFAHIGKRNIVSMLGGTTIALLLISMILIIALRSFKIGVISIMPNLVPAAMGFGLWAILVGEVGLALSIVTGMTLG